jgi:hypothetical protein
MESFCFFQNQVGLLEKRWDAETCMVSTRPGARRGRSFDLAPRGLRCRARDGAGKDVLLVLDGYDDVSIVAWTVVSLSMLFAALRAVDLLDAFVFFCREGL